MIKTLLFPSVYEATLRDYSTRNDSILGFSKIKMDGVDYIVGLQAFTEGVSPHKSINASPADPDYKLISQSALVLALNESAKASKSSVFPKLAITTGFPFATFQYNKDEAVEYFKSDKIITYYKADESGNMITEQTLVPVASVNVMPEILGCDYAIRKGENPSQENYIIISLGYGTTEGVVSTPEGVLNRSLFSVHGINYAVNVFAQEVYKHSYLRLKTEHQIDQIFSKGFIYIDRKRRDFSEEKLQSLKIYYTNVLSPAIRKYVSDEDFELCSKIVLVGGGAYHQELVNLFNEEFGGICAVTIQPQPEKCASIGYALFSKNHTFQESNKDSLSYHQDRDNIACVGIDIGNANTCVSVIFNNHSVDNSGL
jgi:hypothetical protein